MQTTLLGLAIAFIIALIAALVGPYFVDWNQFRAQFEAEATRVIGAPVRVDGMLDARILPTPTLRLRSVAVGGTTASGKMSADKLDVEFSLSSLMRGEWRASELSLDGFALDFGLDRQGRIEGPVSSGRFNLGSLAIDRLNLAGRVVLNDAASGASLELSGLNFNGDVRTLAGTMRGEGSFVLLGARTPFRISSGQSSDGKGTRFRFIADPGDRALFADLDGVLTFDARVPTFDGALTLARPADAKSSSRMGSDSGLPWRVSSRIKASTTSTIIEQIEAIYGPDDRALRFAGAGDMRFGASPLLRVALSARQLDADRLLNRSIQGGETVSLFASLRRAVTLLPNAPIPVQVALAADQIALGGRPIQNVAIDLRSDTKVWTFGKFEMRAPGATGVSASGEISSPGSTARFSGPVAIDSADPHTFAAWLKGRGDVAYRGQKPLRVRGNMLIAPDRVNIEDLKAEVDGGIMEGRVALLNGSNGTTKLDAALKSNNFNLDAAGSFVASLAGSQPDWPEEAKISLDVDRAVLAGQDIRPVTVDFAYGPKSISLDRVKIGDAGGVSLNGAGSLDRMTGGGKLSLAVNAPSLAQVGSILSPFAPMVADRLNSLPAMAGNSQMQLAVDIDKSTDQSRANVRAALDVDAPQIKGAMIFTAMPPLDAARGLDLAALMRSEIKVDSKLASEQSSSMLALLGLDRVLSAQDGPAQFESSVTGAWRTPLQLKATLMGAGFDGDVQGTADPWIEPAKANINLVTRRADPSILFGLKPASMTETGIGLSSRLNISGNFLAFDDLDATFGGSRVRGRLSVTRGDVAEVKGEVGVDALDLPPVIALALGAAGRDAAEPLARGMLNRWRGSISFDSLRAILPGGVEVRQFGGVLRGDGQALVLDNGKGKLGGGDATVTADARQTSDGTSINANVQIVDADGADLRLRGLAMPEGKISIQVSLASQGRSASALSGALSGAGTLTLKDARIAGLGLGGFEAAVRASDDRQATDDASLKSIVDPLLSGGALSVPAAQIPFTVKDGRLRVATTPLEALRARVTVSGGYDLVADQMDVRIVLSANVVNPATGRPDIRIDLNGTPDSLSRSIDVASLSSWLAMRSIDRETRKLDQLERGVPLGSEPKSQPMSLEDDLPKVEPIPRSEVKIPVRDPRRRNPNAKAALPAAGSPPQSAPLRDSTSDQPTPAQPLPPPINVRPAPGTVKPAKPRPPVVLTPPASGTTIF